MQFSLQEPQIARVEFLLFTKTWRIFDSQLLENHVDRYAPPTTTTATTTTGTTFDSMLMQSKVAARAPLSMAASLSFPCARVQRILQVVVSDWLNFYSVAGTIVAQPYT